MLKKTLCYSSVIGAYTALKNARKAECEAMGEKAARELRIGAEKLANSNKNKEDYGAKFGAHFGEVVYDKAKADIVYGAGAATDAATDAAAAGVVAVAAVGATAIGVVTGAIPLSVVAAAVAPAMPFIVGVAVIGGGLMAVSSVWNYAFGAKKEEKVKN